MQRPFTDSFWDRAHPRSVLFTWFWCEETFLCSEYQPDSKVLFKCTIAHLQRTFILTQRNISLGCKCCVNAHLQKTYTDSSWDGAHLRFIHFIHQPHNHHTHHTHNHHVWCMEYTHRDKYMFIHIYVGLLCSKYQPDSKCCVNAHLQRIFLRRSSPSLHPLHTSAS